MEKNKYYIVVIIVGMLFQGLCAMLLTGEERGGNLLSFGTASDLSRFGSRLENSEHSPRKEHALWIFSADGKFIKRSAFAEFRSDSMAKSIVPIDEIVKEYQIEQVIALAEKNPKTDSCVLMPLFRLPEQARMSNLNSQTLLEDEEFVMEDEISGEHIENFCGMLSSSCLACSGNSRVAVYGAGNNSNVYVMLACYMAQATISRKFKNSQVEGVEETLLGFQFAELMKSNDMNVKTEAANIILQEIYAQILPRKVSLNDCLTKPQQQFVHKFCLSTLSFRHPVVRRASFNRLCLRRGRNDSTKRGLTLQLA